MGHHEQGRANDWNRRECGLAGVHFIRAEQREEGQLGSLLRIPIGIGGSAGLLFYQRLLGVSSPIDGPVSGGRIPSRKRRAAAEVRCHKQGRMGVVLSQQRQIHAGAICDTLWQMGQETGLFDPSSHLEGGIVWPIARMGGRQRQRGALSSPAPFPALGSGGGECLSV